TLRHTCSETQLDVLQRGVEAIVVSPLVYGATAFTFDSDSSASWFSVVGIYATVVYAVGRLLRAACQYVSTRAIYEETPNPEILMDLCDGIFASRLQEGPEALLREYTLYMELMRVLRQPEL